MFRGSEGKGRDERYIYLQDDMKKKTTLLICNYWILMLRKKKDGIEICISLVGAGM